MLSSASARVNVLPPTVNNNVAFQPTSSEPSRDDLPHKQKEARDLTWSHVNFVAGQSKVLTDCWGEVI